MKDARPALRLATTQPSSESSSTNLAPAVHSLPSRTRMVAITSGKGGVGKTNVAVNLAAALAARQLRVSLLDADLGLANVDVLLGLSPQWNIGHVLTGQRTIQEVTIRTKTGVRLIPGGSGVADLANLTQAQNRQLVRELRAVENESDFVILDTAAGIASNVTGVLSAATETIVVCTPDPASVIDAYAVTKILHQQSPVKPIWIVINDVFDAVEAERAFAQIRSAAEKFLKRTVEHLGTIPSDTDLARSVRNQLPVLEYAPQARSSRAFHLMANFLLQSQYRSAQRTDIRMFWNLISC